MGTRFSLVLSAALTVCFFCLAAAAQQGPIVIGQAVLSTETTQNGIALPSGGTIFDGDLIVTGASGSAVVKLSPTTQVTLNANTTVHFARVVQRTWLRLQKGTVVVENTGKDFAVVETPKFQIVPGTEASSKAYVGLMADNSTYLESAEGNMVIDDIKSGQSYILAAGQSTLVPADASGVPGLQAQAVVPAPPVKEAPPTPPPTTPPKPPSHHTGLIVGIAAAAGVAGGVAALAGGGGGGGPPASPSAP
jgi:hypothetical protein